MAYGPWYYVMPALDAGIQGQQALSLLLWIAGSGPAMTIHQLASLPAGVSAKPMALGHMRA
jgi:hypothetical protein